MAKLIYPRATEVALTGVDGGSMTGKGPNRGVIHTTETSGIFRAKTYYHIQIHPPTRSIVQFIDLSRASRALANGPDPVQTNRIGTFCPNIAIAGYAKDSPNLDDWTINEFAELLLWCEEEMGIPAEFPLEFQGGEAYGTKGVGRLTVEQWKNITGWVGHQDVPDGNTHWDPGKFPAEKVLARIDEIVEDLMGRFKDVSDDNVHKDDIEWLAETGITRGVNPPKNDRFAPNAPVTRGQLASFLRRYDEYRRRSA